MLCLVFGIGFDLIVESYCLQRDLIFMPFNEVSHYNIGSLIAGALVVQPISYTLVTDLGQICLQRGKAVETNVSVARR